VDITGTQYGAVWPSKFKWKDYEAYVLGFVRRHAPDVTVRRNVGIRGVKSGKLRQIDILVERQIADFKLRIAIDCKCYKRKLSVDDVEQFLGTLNDIRVSKGVLVTAKGYSKTAFQRAQNEARDIELRIVTPDRLSEFQHIGNAFPWREPVGAVVSTPEGWLVDNQPSAASLFTMYPLGQTRESALGSEAFLYGQICLKDADTPTMEAIATRHEENILAKVPTAKFERLRPVVRKSRSGREPEKTLFRVGYIHEGYRGPEYSLYIDHPKGVLLLVLFCPEGQDEAYVPILKWLGETTLMMDCVDKRPERINETPGRISVYWNRAKHVRVWKRETPDVPWEQVREFVEILQPIRSLPPPRTAVPEGMLLIESCEFASVVIPTDGLARRDFPGEGWAIPLWDPSGPTPKPKILIRFRGVDEPAEVKDPQSLVFYTSTRYPTAPDTWPPVSGVDITKTTTQETGTGW